jgi:phosphoribosyl 1,2-cyclic phosphodiesterase
MRLKVINTGSKGNAYLLYNEQEALLIEAGVVIKQIKEALNFDYSKLVGCIVSHVHQDHAKAINDVMSLGINVYAEENVFKKMGFSSRSVNIQPHKPFQLGNFKIMPFDVKHDVPCLGFLIYHPECGKTLFITDTFYCPYTFKGLNNIIIEANYSKNIIDKKYGADSGLEFLRNRILKSHFSLENCIEMLKSNDLKAVNKIMLIHLSDTNSDEKMFQEEVFLSTGKNVLVANKGMDLEFNKDDF